MLCRCKRNCKQKLDVNKKMAFEGICKGEVCKQTTPLLKWLLYRKRDGSVIKEEQTSRQGNCLEVKEHVLHEGEVYELKLLAYFPKVNKNVSKTYVIITNESPSGGNCTVDKKEGIVLATNFTFTCFGWKDKDAGLIYQFGYTTSNGAYEIIQEGRQNVLTTDKLPIGKAAKDHEVQVDIHVKDQWGGYGMKSVTVKV